VSSDVLDHLYVHNSEVEVFLLEVKSWGYCDSDFAIPSGSGLSDFVGHVDLFERFEGIVKGK